MEVIATSINGLTILQEDYETTYVKDGGGKFVVNGEWDSGEAWINDAGYWDAREDGMVKLGNEQNEICFTFEDTEEEWDKFANAVI